MNEILSQIVADLFDKSKGELSPKIQYLRNEIKKVIESEGTVFGKFRGLVESFREIIPDEKQRYNAAIKALTTTSKLSKQEIVTAVNNQLEELKILEKSLVQALPGWRDGLKVMEAKAQEMRNEMAKLRERIAWLENEEKGTLNGMVTCQMEAEIAEKAMRELFADIGAEITHIKNKVEEFTAESAAPQPIPQNAPVKTEIPIEKKEVGEQKIEIDEPAAPQEQDTEWQKKCPMCGGRMSFYIHTEMWQCYSCGHEELKTDEVQGKSEEKSELTNEPEPAPASEPFTVPLADLSSHEYQEPKKKSSPYSSQPPTKKKACPVCHKKMQWYEMERAWRCSFCDYERRI